MVTQARRPRRGGSPALTEERRGPIDPVAIRSEHFGGDAGVAVGLIPPITFDGFAYARERLDAVTGQHARRVDEVPEPVAPGKAAGIGEPLLHTLEQRIE